MRIFVIAAALVLMASAAQAQTPANPMSRLAWEVTDATVEVAQASTYKLYVDALPAVVLEHTCVAGIPAVTCQAPVTAMTPGQHTLAVSRSVTVLGVTNESLKSNSIDIVMLILARPANLRLVSQ